MVVLLGDDGEEETRRRESETKWKRMGRDYPSVLVGLNLGKKDLREPKTEG